MHKEILPRTDPRVRVHFSAMTIVGIISGKLDEECADEFKASVLVERMEPTRRALDDALSLPNFGVDEEGLQKRLCFRAIHLALVLAYPKLSPNTSARRLKRIFEEMAKSIIRRTPPKLSSKERTRLMSFLAALIGVLSAQQENEST